MSLNINWLLGRWVKLKIICFLLFIFNLLGLSGCTTVAYHTADVIDNKLTLGDQVEDQVIKYKARYLIYQMPYDSQKNFVSIEVYDQRILVLGEVQNQALERQIDQKLASIPQVYRVNDYLRVGAQHSWSEWSKDAVITGQAESIVFLTEGLNHFHYDIYTQAGVVYLCGQANLKEEKEVLYKIRQLIGVNKVVTIFPRPYPGKSPIYS